MNAPAPLPREVARKITFTTAFGGGKKWFEKLMSKPADEAGRKILPLGKIYGIANGYTAGATDLGEFVKFAGQFRSVNYETGESADAPQVILPNFLAGSLKGAIDAPERAGPVQIALEVAAEYDAEAVTKYRYILRDLLPPAVNDPLAALEQSMSQGVMALAAPAAADPAPALPPAAAPAAPAAKGRK